MPDEEQWISIPGFVGTYEISNLGSVRSIGQRRSGRVWSHPPRVLSPRRSRETNPYLIVTLTGGAQRLVHRLVLESFVGPAPAGYHADHINGNGLDNRLPNLRWLLASKNISIARKHSGEANGSAKLTLAEVRTIRCLCQEGIAKKALARRFGVSDTTIRRVVKGETWRLIDT